MEGRAPRIQELSCMWGLLRVVESCHSRSSCKLISNGRPFNKQTIDYPRKLDQRRSFDEECRRIQLQNEAVAGMKAKRDAEFSDRFLQTPKRSKGSFQSSLFRLNNKEISSDDELTLAAVIKAVCCQNHIPENCTQTSAKAISNQMFAETKKETVKSILEAGECEGLGPNSSFEKGRISGDLRRNSSDKIVILKPAKDSENVRCRCSSHKKVLEAKHRPFSFREMRRKLKHTFGGPRKESNKFSDVKTKGNLHQEFDVILEAKKHLSARFQNLNSSDTAINESNSWKTLGRILSSPEAMSSPYKDSPTFGESSSEIPRFCYSPVRTKTEVYEKYGGNNSLQIPSTDQQTHDDIHRDELKSNGKSKIVEIDSNDLTRTKQRNEGTEAQKADENDSLSENEASLKYQDEHQSPVSVLEPFFVEEASSPPSFTLQTGKSEDGHKLKPRCLDFKECSLESSSSDPQNNANSCMQEQEQEQDHLSQYVHLVLQASGLNWDQLSEIMSPDEGLLDSFIFDEVEFLSPTDCYFDPKLLFDRINEVLVEIYECHLRFPRWLSFVEPKIRYAALEEIVVDEILKEAEFFLMPWTEKRTLDQLVSNDVAKCRSWIETRADTEEIVDGISEEFMEGFILDVLVEFCS